MYRSQGDDSPYSGIGFRFESPHGGYKTHDFNHVQIYNPDVFFVDTEWLPESIPCFPAIALSQNTLSLFCYALSSFYGKCYFNFFFTGVNIDHEIKECLRLYFPIEQEEEKKRQKKKKGH